MLDCCVYENDTHLTIAYFKAETLPGAFEAAEKILAKRGATKDGWILSVNATRYALKEKGAEWHGATQKEVKTGPYPSAKEALLSLGELYCEPHDWAAEPLYVTTPDVEGKFCAGTLVRWVDYVEALPPVSDEEILAVLRAVEAGTFTAMRVEPSLTRRYYKLSTDARCVWFDDCGDMDYLEWYVSPCKRGWVYPMAREIAPDLGDYFAHVDESSAAHNAWGWFDE